MTNEDKVLDKIKRREEFTDDELMCLITKYFVGESEHMKLKTSVLMMTIVEISGQVFAIYWHKWNRGRREMTFCNRVPERVN